MTLIIILLASVLMLFLIFAVFLKLDEFRAELDYIDLELRRCTSIREKKYWKKKKRQLWLSLLIPFYRKK